MSTDTFIQWKGTDLCMDFYCDCGKQSHICGMFAYHIKCPHCGAIYKLSEKIDLQKVDKEPEFGLLEGEDL